MQALVYCFPGMLQKKVEDVLIEEYELKDIDILLTGHHGSGTSSDPYFIGSLNLKSAVISTNGKYGHPDKKTLAALNKYLVNTFSTKENGTVSVYSTKNYCFITSRNKAFIFVK